MRQTKLVFEVTFDPQLANDDLVQWKVHRSPIFDNESRGYKCPVEFQKYQVHCGRKSRTKADSSRQEDSCPERHGTEENSDFRVEIRG